MKQFLYRLVATGMATWVAYGVAEWMTDMGKYCYHGHCESRYTGSHLGLSFVCAVLLYGLVQTWKARPWGTRQ